MSALHSTCAPMQMTWWYLTYFDITDHNDIDIDYDLTNQHLSQFLSWWRRVFFLSDICRFSAIAWFLQFFAHLCTSVHLSRFFKMAGFSEIASLLQANKSCFQAQPLQAEKSCYLRIWSWANRVLLNVMFPVQTFKQWELLCKPVPWRPGSFGCKKQKASAQKSLFLSLCLNRLEQYGVALCLSKAVDLDRWTDWRPTRSNWFALPTSASLSQQIESQDKDGIALAKIWSSKSLDWFELRLCLQALTRCFVECDDQQVLQMAARLWDHTVMKHAYRT